jgi:hypothetical protein
MSRYFARLAARSTGAVAAPLPPGPARTEAEADPFQEAPATKSDAVRNPQRTQATTTSPAMPMTAELASPKPPAVHPVMEPLATRTTPESAPIAEAVARPPKSTPREAAAPPRTPKAPQAPAEMPRATLSATRQTATPKVEPQRVERPAAAAAPSPAARVRAVQGRPPVEERVSPPPAAASPTKEVAPAKAPPLSMAPELRTGSIGERRLEAPRPDAPEAPQDDGPRLVIDRLRVDVLPAAPAPSRVTRVVERRRAPEAAAPTSQLRYGLGQM